MYKRQDIDGRKKQGYYVYSDQYLSPTILTGGADFKGGVPLIKCSTTKKIRYLTINEIRQSMGFPKSLKIKNTYNITARLYGNAVIPQVVKAIVKQAFLPFL